MQAVIGSNYGDEGKGLITDYLSSCYKKVLVVRYNGGAQAGHNVVSPQQQRHVFHQLSSGSFTGATTFLSQPVIFDPNSLIDDHLAFSKYRQVPNIYVHPQCVVATPYDLLMNQLAEYCRGKAKHGSCGLGIGETVERNLQTDFQLKVSDLLNRVIVISNLSAFGVIGLLSVLRN